MKNKLVLSSSYDNVRELIEEGIGSYDIKSTKIGVIDGCGYCGIVTASSADNLLMHAADCIIDNHEVNGGIYAASDVDLVIEQATEHNKLPGLNRVSEKTWELVKSIIRSMIISYSVRHEPMPEAERAEMDVHADRVFSRAA